MGKRLTAMFFVAALVGTSCSGGDDTTTATEAPSAPTTDVATTEPAATEPPATEPPATEPAPGLPTDAEDASFTTRPGVRQIGILDAEPGDKVSVLAADGTEVAVGEVDELGSFLLRHVAPGDYAVLTEGDTRQLSELSTVITEDDIPEQSFFSDQVLPTKGLGYITVRDGTTLSETVWLPGEADAGPYPTVVEYSGYGLSDPNSSTFATLFNALGYAYVAVNMRGSGCSGGSFRYFELSQQTDGYDMIEAIAAQPWVLNNKVGMVGISYSGISQLYVAKMAPPSLEAITPLSVIENAYRSVLYPGGLLNTGFALQWTAERMEQTKPYGFDWSKELADNGDEECARNQNMRLQNDDLVAEIRATPYYIPDYEDELSPADWVDQITVPVFLAGAFQDEQTGGRWPTMIDNFTGTDHLYVNLVNGLHTESLSINVFERYSEFLSLYVKHETPAYGSARVVAPVLASSVFGVGEAELPADRFEGMSYEDSLAAYESEPSVRVLFEEGANEAYEPGAPAARYVREFDSWPIPETEVARFFLNGDGTLTDDAPAADGGSSDYVADPSALPSVFHPGDDSIWKPNPTYDWQPIPDGKGLVFTSDAFDEDTVIAGTGSADLWVSSDAADTDLEVTVIEVRPDGIEYYVQTGFLRASHRLLDEDASTELDPVQTHLEADLQPMTDELVPVRVEIFPFAHAFRAGSKLRITIDAPGDNRPGWELETISDGETVTIGHDADHPSSIALGVVPGVKVPAGLPACPSLKGQPCRPDARS